MKNQIRLHLEGERYGKLVVTEEARRANIIWR